MQGLLNVLIYNRRGHETIFEMFHASSGLVRVGKAANS